MTEKKGTPAAVRHLRGAAGRPGAGVELPPAPDAELTNEAMDVETWEAINAGLAKLREPFPVDQIEKLPKPMWKGAWDGERGGNCPECHGYHVLSNAIHLDYVGHANVTNRLLEADPYWEWQPLALTPEGLPLFDRSGGLWIELTVCGVTRKGYGDGKSVKEVIGDAIRNAAMRFGVALNLWSKIDLHAERNPGDGQAPPAPQSRSNGHSGVARDRRGGAVRQADAPPARAANQDALDALGSVCEEHGYPRGEMRPLYIAWAAENDRPDTDILDAAAQDLFDFGGHLVALATSDPRNGDDDAGGDSGQPVGGADDADSQPPPEGMF